MERSLRVIFSVTRLFCKERQELAGQTNPARDILAYEIAPGETHSQPKYTTSSLESSLRKILTNNNFSKIDQCPCFIEEIFHLQSANNSL